LRVLRDLDASSLLTMLPVINSAPDGPHRDGRRLAGGFSCGRLARRPQDGALDAWIRAAPTQHPGHGVVRFPARCLRMFAQQALSHHDLPRLAPATLGHLFVDPCLLKGGEFPVSDALDRGDLLAIDMADRRDT